ncbi:50S ribosomal protein L10 [candidate division WWE3 bacterium]|nr:50S ribosomal protein L10 [candidate division WWE3 bacterium]
MPKQKNIEKVKNLTEKLGKAKSVIFAEYTGLDANNMNMLRKELRAEGAEINIARNTLMRLALADAETSKEVAADMTEELSGQMMTLLSYEDAVTPLKKLVEFAKEHETPKVKLGLFEGRVLSVAEVEELSNLPSREELLARVVGGLKSPLSGFANVLGGTQRNFVYALSAIADQKSE